MPTADDIAVGLEKVLSSAVFSRSERARRLLKHLVQKEQAGETDQLKGFCLAIDVFGRGADFDPASDAVVRVQMGRLRDLLVQFYAEEGRTEPVRIVLSRGSYIPSYVFNVASWTAKPLPAPENVLQPVEGRPEPENAIPVPAPVAGRRKTGERYGMLAVGTLALTIMGAAIAFSPGLFQQTQTMASRSPIRSVADLSGINEIDRLPRITLVAHEPDETVQVVAFTLRRAISGFDTLSFQHSNGTEIEIDARDFRLRLHTLPSRPLVQAELSYAQTGEVLLTRNFEQGLSPEERLDRVASMMTEIGPVTGVIYSHLANRQRISGVPHCMVLNNEFYQAPSQKTFDAAYECLSDALTNGSRSPLVPAELAALIAKSASEGYVLPEPHTLEDAVLLARQAIARGPTSPYAHRSYGFVHAMMRQHPVSEFWMGRAYELNTFDLSMAAAYAYSLINGGKYEQGKALMERALIYSSAHPAWWEYSFFIAAFMTGQWQDAQNISQLLQTSQSPRHIAAVLIMANRAGDSAKVRQMLEKLRAVAPMAIARPETLYPAGNTQQETRYLVEALREAGLGEVQQPEH